MVNYVKIHSTKEPQEIEIKNNYVFCNSNIVPYEEQLDDRTITGYEYDCTQDTKDEYLLLLTTKNKTLEEELAATKILLGVD